MKPDARLQAAIDAGHPEWALLADHWKAAGLSRYFFTGIPCKNGHVGLLRTSSRSNTCPVCNLEKVNLKNKDPFFRGKSNKFGAELELARQYKRTRPPLAYLTHTAHKQILDIYVEAARRTLETGTRHTVDHVVPRFHPDVCGLHAPWNMQILTVSDNSRKSNKFDGTMENEGWRQ